MGRSSSDVLVTSITKQRRGHESRASHGVCKFDISYTTLWYLEHSPNYASDFNRNTAVV